MADLAIGRTCPSDGTLTACSGSFSDELLVGQCAVCQNQVSVSNPMYVSGSAEEPEQEALTQDSEPESESEPEQPDEWESSNA